MAHSPKRSEKLKYVEIKCPNRNYIQFSRWRITHILLGYMPYNSWDAHLSIIMAYYGSVLHHVQLVHAGSVGHVKKFKDLVDDRDWHPPTTGYCTHLLIIY